MLNVIRRKPKVPGQANAATGETDGDQGDIKRDAAVRPQGVAEPYTAAHQSNAEAAAASRSFAAANKNAANLNRGSEFKKNAQ